MAYYKVKNDHASLLTRDLVLVMFAHDTGTAIERFIRFNETENEDKCLDDDKIKRLHDEEAREKIKKVLAGFSLTEIKSLRKKQRDEVLSRVKSIEGVTQRQAARILGVSPNLIFKP